MATSTLNMPSIPNSLSITSINKFITPGSSHSSSKSIPISEVSLTPKSSCLTPEPVRPLPKFETNKKEVEEKKGKSCVLTKTQMEFEHQKVKSRLM